MTTSPMLRALVVEDDPAWQQLLAEVLGDAGLSVDIAGNLEAAIACLRAAPHRLAVVDLALAGSDHSNQDGLQVLEAARRHDPGCVPLLLTGYATVELAVSVLTEHGAYTCLRKETFRRARLRELVDQVLTGAPAGAGPATPVTWATTPLSTHREQDSAPHPTEPMASAAGGLALIVEDDAGWRSILHELLTDAGFQVHTCLSYGEALGYLRRIDYDLAVVDLTLASSLAPEGNRDGYRLLANTRDLGIPSIVVSGSARPQEVDRAYREHHIIAYLEKRSFDRRGFLQAIQQLRTTAENAGDAGQPLAMLTSREREVLDLLVEGMTNKDIAAALVISTNTVKRHLKAIYAKLDVKTRSAAVAQALNADRQVD